MTVTPNLTILFGDCQEQLKNIATGSVQCCVTSPPYYGLRDYGTPGQIGLEPSPEQYILKLIDVFREVKRALAQDGTLWLNLGDSYAGSSKGRNKDGNYHLKDDFKQSTSKGAVQGSIGRSYVSGFKPKDLMGIPWRVALALQQPDYTCHGCRQTHHALQWGHFPDGRLICPVCMQSGKVTVHKGWWLRQDIIWSKPNPMPESVKDRCTKSHEYLFLFSKSRKYYFDQEAIKQPITEGTLLRLDQDLDNQQGSDRAVGKFNGRMKAKGNLVGRKKHKNLDYKGMKLHTMHRTRNDNGEEYLSEGLANKRSVWTVAAPKTKEEHFATFPDDLIVDCIKAGSRPGDIVLDCFFGSGTTAVVSRKLDRKVIGIDNNEKYLKIANRKLHNKVGLFL